MEDSMIVDLYWSRDEAAISESDRKYGSMLRSLSRSVTGSREDAEECTNDTYLAAWNAMPTARPAFLGAFLSKIIRRISIDRFRREHRSKRGGMGTDALLDELAECIPDPGGTPAEQLETQRLRETIDRFAASLPPDKRVLFVNRYFYAVPIAELASCSGMTENNVKVTLFRIREQLRILLEKEELM